MHDELLDNGTLSTRKCRKCQQEKPTLEFVPERWTCLACDKIRRKAYYEKNKAQILKRTGENHKRYYAQHRDRILAKARMRSGGIARGVFVPPTIEVATTPPPKAELLYVNDQLEMFSNCRRRGREHQQNVLATWTTSFVCQDCLDREVKLKELKAMQKIKRNLRYRLKKILKVLKRNGDTHHICKRSDMLGCSATDLKRHIEAQFQSGMSWDNYGSVWHVDHIRPCASFDLTKVEEQVKMNNYLNLRPLWAQENIMKGATYDTNGL